MILYWIKNTVWQPAEKAIKGDGGHLCLDCAGRAIGHALTLHDLDILNYMHTARNMPDQPDFMRYYTRATVIGALNATGLPIPEGWKQPSALPHIDALLIGEQLARQTYDPESILPALIATVEQTFP